MLHRLKKIVHEDLTSPQAQEAIGDFDLAEAYNNFWHYRGCDEPAPAIARHVVSALDLSQAAHVLECSLSDSITGTGTYSDASEGTHGVSDLSDFSPGKQQPGSTVGATRSRAT
jgi:hypothetical protein